jgi:hypothetical protein
MGKFECSNAVPAQPVSCIDIQAPYLQLDKRLKYRLRVVNVGYVKPDSHKNNPGS